MTNKQINKIKNNTQTIAYIYAILSIFLWSTVATAFKIALKEYQYFDLLFGASLVSFLSLFVLTIILGKSKELFFFNFKDLSFNILLGFLNPFVYYLLLFKAYSILPAQEALTLNYTWAAWLIILSSLFLKEKMNFKKITSIILSSIGIILIATKGEISQLHFKNIFGVLIALSSAVVWASYWIINVKNNSDKIVTLTRNFFFGTIFTLLFWVFNFDQFVIHSNSLFAITYIGLFEMGITFYFWLNALSLSVEKSKVTNLIYLSPFVSLLLINTFTGEKILFSTIIGLILIILGIIFEQFKR